MVKCSIVALLMMTVVDFDRCTNRFLLLELSVVKVILDPVFSCRKLGFSVANELLKSSPKPPKAAFQNFIKNRVNELSMVNGILDPIFDLLKAGIFGG